MTKKLTEELGTASCIKSRENRHSVTSALTSILARLKLYKNVPPNGLAIFSGEVFDEELNREKKILIDLEPLKPVTVSVYLCDNRFHTDILAKTLNIGERRFGFIIVDGKGTLFGLVQGNTREVITKFSIDLPPKHGRGGQSSNRFANIRTEKRHNYLTKIAEMAVKCFISNDSSNVDGLILAGSADLKFELGNLGVLDPRLGSRIIKYVDITYGLEAGFYQAIQLAADSLQNIKLVQEIKLIGEYFQHIAKDTGLVCFGVEETFRALEVGSVETLIVWEELNLIRYVLNESDRKNETIVYFTAEQIKVIHLFDMQIRW
jgi:peptide chain release factor subunit 1